MTEPQYYIAQGQDVQGPFPRSRILSWIEQGKVRDDMLFSLEGGDWVPGHDVPELFPTATPAPLAAPAPGHAPVRGGAPAPARRRGGRAPRRRRDDYDDYDDEPRGRRSLHRGKPRAPSSVMVVVILDFIGAAIYGGLGVFSIIAVAAVRSTGEKTGAAGNFLLLLGMFTIALAIAFIVLGILIKGGSNGARIAQVIISGLALLSGMGGLASGDVGFGTLFGIAINILIIAMLFGREASMFFAEASGRGGRPRGRRRRY